MGELLEEQKQVIEEQKKAQLAQQQQEEKVAEEKRRRLTEQEKEQLRRQHENSIQVKKLAKAEAVTAKATKATTKPRRIRLRITSSSTQKPAVTSTTSPGLN